jgi:hypothetical protein
MEGRSLLTVHRAVFCTFLSVLLLSSGCRLMPQAGNDELIARAEESLDTAPEIVRKSTVLLDMEGLFCTGTIVAVDRILTAAHCVEDIEDAQSVVVRFGTNMSEAHISRRGTGKPLVHKDADLAVIRIEAIPEGYAPAPIHNVNDWEQGEEGRAVIAGFGKSHSERDDHGEVLRWGYTTFYMSLEDFEFENGKSYASLLWFWFSGSETSERATQCFGDSGGPVYRNVNGNWALAGVISGGAVECQKYSDTIAEDLEGIHDWIFSHIEESESCVIQGNLDSVHPEMAHFVI